jgi:hypothetical protein
LEFTYKWIESQLSKADRKKAAIAG